jgi:adenylate cyclase
MPTRWLRLRNRIAVRLLAAFLVVSLLPIGILGYLSWQEAREPAGAHEEDLARGEVEEEGGAAEGSSEERLFGLPIATVELIVAGVSLGLSIAMALYLARTLVRPLRQLQGSMRRVEDGNLDVTTSVSSMDEIGELTRSFNRMVEGLRRATLVRDLFGQYVTPELAEAAIERRGQLDGQLVTATVLFADIRDFTGIAEALPASRLIKILNDYFERMSVVVVEEDGFVNKFGGDSLLAVFGTPLNPSPDHSVRAVRAAVRMRSALARFNREQEDAWLPQIMIGIGVATGDVVAGNVGSERKLEYTVIGDAVNVASRLQAMTKELDKSVLTDGETARDAAAVANCVLVGEISVRGKRRTVQVFSVEDARDAMEQGERRSVAPPSAHEA